MEQAKRLELTEPSQIQLQMRFLQIHPTLPPHKLTALACNDLAKIAGAWPRWGLNCAQQSWRSSPARTEPDVKTQPDEKRAAHGKRPASEGDAKQGRASVKLPTTNPPLRPFVASGEPARQPPACECNTSAGTGGTRPRSGRAPTRLYLRFITPNAPQPIEKLRSVTPFPPGG